MYISESQMSYTETIKVRREARTYVARLSADEFANELKNVKAMLRSDYIRVQYIALELKARDERETQARISAEYRARRAA